MRDELISTTSMEPVLHIASVAVHVRPDVMPKIRYWVESFPGAETCLEDACGKLVVALETEIERKILELLDGLNAQAGVLNAALVYHEILTGEPQNI